MRPAIGGKQLVEHRKANKTITEDMENSVLSQLKASFSIVPRNTKHAHVDFSRAKCAQPHDEGVVIFRTVPRNDIAAVEAAELEHEKAFDELSDAKNEEVAASTQQYEKKSFEEQETKLSNDCNTTELERTQESFGEQETFLANLKATGHLSNQMTSDARHAERLAEIQIIIDH